MKDIFLLHFFLHWNFLQIFRGTHKNKAVISSLNPIVSFSSLLHFYCIVNHLQFFFHYMHTQILISLNLRMFVRDEQKSKINFFARILKLA